LGLKLPAGCARGTFLFQKGLKLLWSMYLGCTSSMEEETADSKRMEGILVSVDLKHSLEFSVTGTGGRENSNIMDGWIRYYIYI